MDSKRIMAYTVKLSSNQQLMVENRGNQTIVNLFSSSLGQQQIQSNSFSTGIWKSQPELYQTNSGFILQINGELNLQHIFIQANSLKTITNPILNNAKVINLENIPDATVNSQTSFQEAEFEPMQPMQMGNMSMSMRPMSMQMGNMSMSMNEAERATATKRFCSQCGQPTKSSDRFCSSCGHKLDH